MCLCSEYITVLLCSLVHTQIDFKRNFPPQSLYSEEAFKQQPGHSTAWNWAWELMLSWMAKQQYSQGIFSRFRVPVLSCKTSVASPKQHGYYINTLLEVMGTPQLGSCFLRYKILAVLWRKHTFTWQGSEGGISHIFLLESFFAVFL